jgi:hypothetical protein
MEDFTLPNIGARFKKWKCYTPILPKGHAHPHLQTLKNKKIKNLKIGKRGGGARASP